MDFLEKEMFREVISYIYRILEIDSPIQNVGIVYVALYIFKTVN